VVVVVEEEEEEVVVVVVAAVAAAAAVRRRRRCLWWWPGWNDGTRVSNQAAFERLGSGLADVGALLAGALVPLVLEPIADDAFVRHRSFVHDVHHSLILSFCDACFPACRYMALTSCMMMVVVCLVRFVGPQAAGSGIPAVRRRTVLARLLPACLIVE
jgi:hypothetical protein